MVIYIGIKDRQGEAADDWDCYMVYGSIGNAKRGFR